jgi:hypothetical protein
MKKRDDGLPKYVVNWDELTQPLKEELLKIVSEALHDKYPQVNTHNLEAILETIEDLLPANYYQDLQHKIDEFVYKKVEGIQKADGAYLDIPPIIKETQYDFQFNKDVFLIGFHVDQTGWKKEDKYNLVVKKQHLIKGASTKEIGEHKYFNTFFKVNANTPISFILENNSGNSRETMIDLEFIEGTEATIATPPITEIPIGDTILFLDTSGSMHTVLSNMSVKMQNFMSTLNVTDKVSICFVADSAGTAAPHSYPFTRIDFSSKVDAISFMENPSNIVYYGGGMYDVVTIQSVMDNHITDFKNYVFCTDQSLEQHPHPTQFKNLLQGFFTPTMRTYVIPVNDDYDYWEDVYNEMHLFRPLALD